MLKIKRTVIGTMLVSSLLISGCDNQVGQALSSGQQSVKQANYTEKQTNSMDHGFVAYYFVNNLISPSFSIPLLETNLISGELAKYHDKKVTSMIAKTQLIVNKTGKYKLLTNQSGVSLSLNGANVSEDGVNLQAQQAYELALSYKPNDGIFKDIKLQWVTSDSSSIMDVPVNNLLFSYQGALNQTSRNRSSAACNAFGLTDTSCNGIPDEWAIHGYTVFTNPNTGIILLEKWDDILHGNKPQYTRYFSAVYKYSTADDPYSDYQKVTGIGLDKGVSKDARNPLIAAVPIIYAKSEGVIISKNTNITTDINGNSGKSVSISTSNSATDGSSDDVGGSLSISPGISIFPPNISVNDTFTAKYDHQWNHSQTLTQGKDSSGSVNNGWSTSLNMNNADAAYFLPIMRYENIGTAPVYDLAPTFTFMEPKQKLVLTSVTAKSNSIANSLLPNTAYPKAGQPGILISGNDDFNSQPAKLNKTQLDALEKNKIFTTYVNQFTAKVKFFNSSGQPINLPDFDNSWEPYLTQSGQTTAQIKLFTPDNQVKVRKIAARDPNIPQENLSKPEVLLADALAMIGGIRYNQATKKWEIIDEDGKVTYEMAGIEIFSEPNTMKEINKQLFAMSGSPKDLGKIKLRAKMQLTVCPKGRVDELKRIHNEAELVDAFKGDTSGKLFVLENDIALTRNWAPVGFLTNAIFDGQGHKITGLNVTSLTMTAGCGMFSELRDSTIKNLNLEGTIYCNNANNAGLLTAKIQNRVNITNSNFKSNITGSIDVGGVIGSLYGEMFIESVTVISKVKGKINIGGLVGFGMYGTTTVRNIRVKSYLDAGSRAGGAFGSLYENNATINNIIVDTTINNVLNGDQQIGGAVAAVTGGKFSNIDATVNINGAAADLVGGIIGYKFNLDKVELSNAIAKGLITSTRNQISSRIGGIIALNAPVLFNNIVDMTAIAAYNGTTTHYVNPFGTNSLNHFENSSANVYYALPAGATFITDNNPSPLVAALSGNSVAAQKAFLISKGFDFNKTWTIKKVNNAEIIGIKEDSIPQFPNWN